MQLAHAPATDETPHRARTGGTNKALRDTQTDQDPVSPAESDVQVVAGTFQAPPVTLSHMPVSTESEREAPEFSSIEGRTREARPATQTDPLVAGTFQAPPVTLSHMPVSTESEREAPEFSSIEGRTREARPATQTDPLVAGTFQAPPVTLSHMPVSTESEREAPESSPIEGRTREARPTTQTEPLIAGTLQAPPVTLSHMPVSTESEREAPEFSPIEGRTRKARPATQTEPPEEQVMPPADKAQTPKGAERAKRAAQIHSVEQGTTPTEQEAAAPLKRTDKEEAQETVSVAGREAASVRMPQSFTGEGLQPSDIQAERELSQEDQMHTAAWAEAASQHELGILPPEGLYHAPLSAPISAEGNTSSVKGETPLKKAASVFLAPIQGMTVGHHTARETLAAPERSDWVKPQTALFGSYAADGHSRSAVRTQPVLPLTRRLADAALVQAAQIYGSMALLSNGFFARRTSETAPFGEPGTDAVPAAESGLHAGSDHITGEAKETAAILRDRFVLPEMTYGALPETAAEPAKAASPFLRLRRGDTPTAQEPQMRERRSGASHAAETAGRSVGITAILPKSGKRIRVTADMQEPFRGQSAASGRTNSRRQGGLGPVDMAYASAGVVTPPVHQQEISGEAAGYRESSYVQSLPGWARDFLKDSFSHPVPQRESLTAAPAGHGAKASQRVYPPNLARPAPIGEQQVWTAPGYAGNAKMTHKQKEEAPPPLPMRLSEAEINRMANKVYGIIEERLKRNSRRSGL